VQALLEPLARAGYAARGLVYLVIAGFAGLAAFDRAEMRGSEGALRALLGGPFGEALVWLVIIGLAGFALWRFVQAAYDTDRHGRSAKGLAVRAGLFGSAVAYGALALFGLGLVSAWGEEGAGGDPTRRWLAAAGEAGWAWAIPWLVAALLLAVGAAHIFKGATAKFETYFMADEAKMRVIRPVARGGLVARGLTFLILAWLAFVGGARAGAAAAGGGVVPGLADALRAVQGWPAGWLLLLAVAIGLAAFGIYSLAEAVYRYVNAPEGRTIGL